MAEELLSRQLAKQFSAKNSRRLAFCTSLLDETAENLSKPDGDTCVLRKSEVLAPLFDGPEVHLLAT